VPGKYIFLFIFCLFFGAASIFAQYDQIDFTLLGDIESESALGRTSRQRTRTDDFWISPGMETSLYGMEDIAYGGVFTFGYGNGVSIGLRGAFFSSHEGISTIELNFLLRFFLQGVDALSGLFIQLAVGPVIIAGFGEDISFPSNIGALSAGASLGWRFLFANRWFLEPAVRAGYPYLAGAGLSAGVRF
jgi:hypothetical protein